MGKNGPKTGNISMGCEALRKAEFWTIENNFTSTRVIGLMLT